MYYKSTMVNEKGGQSANKFSKSQIRKFCRLIKLVRLAEFPQMCQFANWRFADQIHFCDLLTKFLFVIQLWASTNEFYK